MSEKKEKTIEITLINSKKRDVYGFGTHSLGESKPYPEGVALSLLNDLTTWQRTEKKVKEIKNG